MIGEVLALAGALLTLLAGVGVVRFPDALTRMHALTKASTVGLGLVAIGAALVLPTANDVTSALLAAALYVVTLPISASMMARATYRAQEVGLELRGVDELAVRLAADAEEEAEATPSALTSGPERAPTSVQNGADEAPQEGA